MTRYKRLREGDSHSYVDHITPLAALFSKRLEEARKGQEWKEICRIADDKERRQKLEAFELSFIDQALACLPACDTEILSPLGESYAYISAPEAKAFCEIHSDYSYQPFEYMEPKKDDERPYYSEELYRIMQSRLDSFENEFLNIKKRNDSDTARKWMMECQQKFNKLIASHMKIMGERNVHREEEEELIHVPEKGGPPPQQAEPADLGAPVFEDGGGPPKKGGVPASISFEIQDLETPQIWTPPEPSISFDTSIEAALEYARSGFAVVPICNFDPAAGHCTGPRKHDEDGRICKGKKPLVKGKANGNEPGSGYTGASRDLRQIEKWFSKSFPRAGVGLRLDGHILIDCDVKDGVNGLESYRVIRDTFGLPDTLTARTHSGGYHFVFKLPEGLPAEYLRSWTRPLDHMGMTGIDLKVSSRGLLFAEPTIGAKGIYRWIDWTAEIMELPRAVCDFFHEAREKKDEKKRRPSQSYASGPRRPITDQSKFFKSVPEGSRHDRLRSVAVAARCQDRRSESELIEIMQQHNAAFAKPLPQKEFDYWAPRTAHSIVQKY